MNKLLFRLTYNVYVMTFLLILLTFNNSLAQQQPVELNEEPDYFPLAVGNVWKYDSRVAGFSEIRRITGTKNIDEHIYYVLAMWVPRLNREVLVTEGLYRKDKENQVLLRIKDKEIVWLKLSADVGEVWAIQFPDEANRYKVTLLEKNVEVDTFAGKFASSMIFTFHHLTAVDADFSITLAPNVGVVEDIHFAWNQLALAEYALLPGNQVDVKSKDKLPTTWGQLKRRYIR